MSASETNLVPSLVLSLLFKELDIHLLLSDCSCCFASDHYAILFNFDSAFFHSQAQCLANTHTHTHIDSLRCQCRGVDGPHPLPVVPLREVCHSPRRAGADDGRRRERALEAARKREVCDISYSKQSKLALGTAAVPMVGSCLHC